MTLPDFAISSDAELVTAARDKTSYDTATLPGDDTQGQARGLIDDAKRELYMRTGADEWYEDVALGQALVAMTALKFKEAVENIEIERYGIGDEDVRFSNASPEDSQQIVSWSQEVTEALKRSEVPFETESNISFTNTASYIG